MESEQAAANEEALPWLDNIADLLDDKFRIPGTSIRFGLDFILGLIPYAGDLISFIISGFLIIIMARYGAGGRLIFKMLGNVWLDGMVGTVPLIGDIFDLSYKANRRNVDLMKAYYGQGKHRGSAWGIIIIIILMLLAMMALSFYVIYRIGYWIVT